MRRTQRPCASGRVFSSHPKAAVRVMFIHAEELESARVAGRCRRGRSYS